MFNDKDIALFNDRNMAFFKQMAETFGTTLEEQIEAAIANKRQWCLESLEGMAEDAENWTYGFDNTLDYNAMTTAELVQVVNKYINDGMEYMFEQDNKLNALIKNSDNVVKLF